MSKAYTNQEFAKPTVITDDAFSFVSFFYASHNKAMKFDDASYKNRYGDPKQYKYDFYWNQAEIFYKAAKQLPFEASPVASYYCMLNAAKSYLSFTLSSADKFISEFGMHGIREEKSDTGKDLSDIRITHNNKGVFPLFASCLDSDFNSIWPANNTSYSLKSLLYNLVFVHRAFTMTYSTARKKVPELFVPLTSSPIYYAGNNSKAHLCIEIDKHFLPENSRTVPSAILKSIDSEYRLLDNSGFHLISKDGVTYYPDSISSELREKNNILRKDFCYILSPKRLWYLKRRSLSLNIDAKVINLSDMTINMAVMHRISEIARYKPEQLNRLMKSKENWLLHEYISMALDQFIDEIASEVTKLDIMCPGMR